MTRSEAIDILVGVIAANSEEENEALDIAIEALKADIVHCKECKHYDEGGFCWHPAAELGDTLATEPTDSCSYGERKDDE